MTSADCDNSLIDILPEEMLSCIFKWLPIEDLVSCEKVCVKWQKLARDPTVWRSLVVVISGKPNEIDVKQRTIAHISSHRDLIYALKIQYVDDYELIKSVMNKCNNLVSLQLVMCKINQTFVVDILKWPRLKVLSLKNSLWSGPDKLLIPFDKLKNLQSLTLCDFGLYPENWSGLLQCRNLCHIYIEKVKTLTLEFVTDLITAQQNLLETFSVYGLNCINVNTMQLISNCPKLRNLGITRCDDLTDESLLTLSSLKSIESLLLWNNSKFTEKALIATLSAPTIKKLKYLSFSKVLNITPTVVNMISENYMNLRFVALCQCPKIIEADFEKQLKYKLFTKVNAILY